MEKISLIFQGNVIENQKINSEVIENLAITRKNFPADEIILSTWKMSDELKQALLQQLMPYRVILLENQDPGPLISRQNSARWVTNINRMLVSSREGICRATHPLVVKLRTDSRLYRDDIKGILDRRQYMEHAFPREPEFALFRQRVINGNIFARNARGHMPYLFHPGDIFLAGDRQDLCDLFDIPLADSSVFEVCFCFSIFTLMRYVPEQYLWVKYIEKVSGKIEFPGNSVFSELLRERSEKFYVNNFIPYTCAELAFCWSKHHQVYKNKGLSSVYYLEDWRRLQQCHDGAGGWRKKSVNNLNRIRVFILRVLLWMKFLPLHSAFIRGIAIRLYGRRC